MIASAKTIVIFLVSLLLAHFLAVYFGWYNYAWTNTLLHLLGGAWTALFFFALFDHFVGEHARHQTTEKIKILIIVVSFSSLMGLLWEAHEYILSQYFSIYLQESVGEVIGSLFVDILGGVLMSIVILYLINGYHKKSQI